jgi:hypothetical protein
MSSLKQQVADKKAQERQPRVDPEIDAKLNRFIQEKPDLYGYYNELSKEQLIRKLMLAKMRKGEYAQDRNERGGGRPASRGRLERARAHTIPKPPNGQSRKAGVGRTG